MISTLCLFLVVGVVAASQSFFSCEPNPIFAIGYWKCCRSNELPHDCECFGIQASDFINLLYHLPECPEYQRVVFTVFNRYLKQFGDPVKAGPGVRTSILLPNISTKIIVHGFDDHGSASWIVEMKDALLNESVHLIGHSLGSHICGYAGKELHRLTGRKVGRITGLDPAGPNFEHFSANVRIDKSDASFVDIIHTNGKHHSSGGFGIRHSFGHVDFYPNGGKHQPNCPLQQVNIFTDSMIKGGLLKTICSHNMAPVFFTNSISTCRSDPWSVTQCTMGYHVNSSCRGESYPTTNLEAPYC